MLCITVILFKKYFKTPVVQFILYYEIRLLILLVGLKNWIMDKIYYIIDY